MNFEWSLFVDLGIIALALCAATLIRARVRFFQAYLIPNAIIAGLLLLLFYNWIAPHLGIGRQGLENLVFHLLNITFIAIALRPTPRRRRQSLAVLGTATVIISCSSACRCCRRCFRVTASWSPWDTRWARDRRSRSA